jgi:hypothetical protein
MLVKIRRCFRVHDEIGVVNMQRSTGRERERKREGEVDDDEATTMMTDGSRWCSG